MAEAQGAMPNLNEVPEGAAAANPDAPLEVTPTYAPHNMRIDARGHMRGYGDPDHLEGDAGLAVEFYVNPIDGMEHVKINVPGEKHMEYDYLAHDGKPPYKERFAMQYAAFKNMDSQLAGQTMLRDVPWIDEAIRLRLTENRVFTLEQLAAVSDTGIQAIGPGTRKMRDRAAEEVANRKAGAEGSALRAEMEEMRKELAELRAQRAALPLGRDDLPAGKKAA